MPAAFSSSRSAGDTRKRPGTSFMPGRSWVWVSTTHTIPSGASAGFFFIAISGSLADRDVNALEDEIRRHIRVAGACDINLVGRDVRADGESEPSPLRVT